jgi:hypothetical protein
MLALPSTMAIAATTALPVLQVLPALLVLRMLPATRSLKALLAFPACRLTCNACNAFTQFRSGMPVLLSMPALMAARRGSNRSIACNAGKLMQRIDATNRAWCRALATASFASIAGKAVIPLIASNVWRNADPLHATT